MKKIFFITMVIGLLLLFFSPYIYGQTGRLYLLTIDGAISPANADYFVRGLDAAVANQADVLVLNLDTPGGLDKSMRYMVQAILASPIPVVIYIYPKGARGASAGTYLLYASHVAAMAPATNIGSATPVSIGVIDPLKKKIKDDKNDHSEQDSQPLSNDFFEGDVLQTKVINDAQAYVRSLAQLRGRNQEWAVQSVIHAANLSANEALESNVIELIAYDLKTLISQLDKREIKLGKKTVVLHLETPQIIPFEPDWRTQVLIVITDPSVAYILMLIGIYGLIFEFLNPGSLLPGTIGAICLVLALYALNTLPISMAGLILLLIGVMLMTAEAFAPSFGILGIGGIIAFGIGSFMLMDSRLPGYQIAPSLIISSTFFTGFLILLVFSMILKARREPVVSGVEQLIGHPAIAIEDFEHSGRILIRGEIWMADSDSRVKKNQPVHVKSINGLRLNVSVEKR